MVRIHARAPALIMEDRILELENKVAEIQKRNARVEANKAWETSGVRIISIAVITYLVVAVILHFINVPRIWLNAIIPTIGFILSIQTLPVIKRWWVKRYLNGPR